MCPACPNTRAICNWRTDGTTECICPGGEVSNATDGTDDCLSKTSLSKYFDLPLILAKICIENIDKKYF